MAKVFIWWNAWLLKTCIWLGFPKACWTVASENKRWYLVISVIINVFFDLVFFCTYNSQSGLPGHALYRFSWVKLKTQIHILSYWHWNVWARCTSGAGEVSAALIVPHSASASSLHVPASPAQPIVGLLRRVQRRDLCYSWAKRPQKKTMTGRKFTAEPMDIPQIVFHSPRSTASLGLMNWHLVRVFAWLFSSLHHFEQCNLCNWYAEVFWVWLKEQILCRGPITVVFAIGFRNHAKEV